jgi:hypothetical protein
MGQVTNANNSAWQSFTPAAAAVLRVTEGSVKVTTNSAAAANDGVPVHENESIGLTGGAPVYYRLASGRSATFVWEVL